MQKLHDYEHSDLDERTKAAMRLMDHLGQNKGEMPAEDYESLREQFTEDELVDLGMAGAFLHGWQRFIETFGIRPDDAVEPNACPWEPS